MADAVPQTKLPQQLQQTQLITPKSDPRAARNLLQKVFRRTGLPLLNQTQTRIDHENYLLKTPLGRDFTIVTAVGVEFKIHSTMLIGGPKMLQEGLYPGGAHNPSPPTFVNLPPHFHPVLVDRIVCFLYRGRYSLDKHSKAKLLHHATHVPATSSPEAYAMPDLPSNMFHLRMCALAEELEYDALLAAAHANLFHVVTNRLAPQHLKELVDAIFASPGSATRICKDERGFLQQLVAIAILVDEVKVWHHDRKKQFTDLMQGEEYAGFWEMCKNLREQNEDLLRSAPTAKAPRGEKTRKPKHGSDVLSKKPDAGRVQKRVAAKDDMRKAAALAKAFKSDEDGDMDMELD